MMRPSRSTVLCLACSLGLAPWLVAQATTDARHYKLEIALDFNSQTITATNTITLRSLVNGLSTVDLDFTSGLSVSAVSMGGAPVGFTRPTDVLRVSLDRAYNNGEDLHIAVDYAGTPPASSGWGGFMFTSHSGGPMAWTLSQPWDAKLWWPGKDTLEDKATFEIWVTHPDTMSAASNGGLQGIDVLSGSRLRTRWHESHPMVPYLASIAVTNFRRRTDTYTSFGANMPVEFFVFPQNWNSWQAGLDLIVPMLTTFSSVYGQYPFVDEKYGIAQFTWGGGMEHQTITSQGSVQGWLSAHELAHQWWGDDVTCATWHDIWLNEGFATFSEAIWKENRVGGTLADYLAHMLSRKPRRTSGTVYVYNATSINNIFSTTNVYYKGAWVVHMLRGALGDTDFFQCLTDYRATYTGGSATTVDFKNSCEATVGRDLDWFFDQWVMNPGSPDYRYAFRSVPAGGTDYLYLELGQVQSAQPVFQMPVRVQVTTTVGTESHTVWNSQREDQFVLPLSAPATGVSIDPDQWILRATPSTRAFTMPFFAAYPETVDVVAGAGIEYHIDHGVSGQGRQYLVLLGLSGSSPGTSLFGLTIPVNFDLLTTAAASAANTPAFPNSLGNLDANGRAVATFNLAPNVAVPVRGLTMTASYVFVDFFDFAADPVDVLFD